MIMGLRDRERDKAKRCVGNALPTPTESISMSLDLTLMMTSSLSGESAIMTVTVGILSAFGTGMGIS
jgi:hypothetical protein